MSWVQRVTEEGHTYYENPTTGESQWEKPLGYEAFATAGSGDLVTEDIEMGNIAANPMHEKGKLERGDSIKAFGKAVKKVVARAAGKGLGGGVGVKQGVNTEALGKLMEGGGGSLERLTIAINCYGYGYGCTKRS
ncbi:hypothetical protein TrST_g85 [Triparma strigata]|uniref:WW domain-containing protein n=1 Tax=Triparma strigata TaxID=1606541 RepID=A0A9W7E6L5_9STRA|nr:hypothetical protein TrST_g85 [Triparma strigata]